MSLVCTRLNGIHYPSIQFVDSTYMWPIRFFKYVVAQKSEFEIWLCIKEEIYSLFFFIFFFLCFVAETVRLFQTQCSRSLYIGSWCAALHPVGFHFNGPWRLGEIHHGLEIARGRNTSPLISSLSSSLYRWWWVAFLLASKLGDDGGATINCIISRGSA